MTRSPVAPPTPTPRPAPPLLLTTLLAPQPPLIPSTRRRTSSPRLRSIPVLDTTRFSDCLTGSATAPFLAQTSPLARLGRARTTPQLQVPVLWARLTPQETAAASEPTPAGISSTNT